jgi:hypothetical protein
VNFQPPPPPELDGPSLSTDFATLMPHWTRVHGPEAMNDVDAAAD